MASLTFGSVGDIITVSSLLVKAVSALSDSCGSSAQYQELLREIRSLNSALQCTSSVIEGDPHVKGSESLRNALSDCYTCLNSYLASITKYQKSLKEGGSKNAIKDRVRKLQWQGHEEQVNRFRLEISSHVSSVNTILSTFSIQANKRDHDALMQHIESKFASFAITDERRNLVLQMDALRQSQESWQESSFNNLFQAISEVSSAAKDSDVIQLNSLLHRLEKLLEQQNIPQKLDKTWTQEPMILDDALGRIFPIHLEFINSWESFLFVLSGHFKCIPGNDKISRKEFLLHRQAGKCIDFDLPWSEAFVPGVTVTMGVVFSRRRVARSSCPLCHADNDDATDCEVQCRDCQTKYRRIVQLDQADLRKTFDEDVWRRLPKRTRKKIEDWNPGSQSPVCTDLAGLQESDREPTEELHAFKRLVLKTNTDSKADAISERQIENLINYNLARDRSEAIMMLLARAPEPPQAPKAPKAADGGEQGGNSKALIRVNRMDQRARKDMQEILDLAATPPPNLQESAAETSSDIFAADEDYYLSPDRVAAISAGFLAKDSPPVSTSTSIISPSLSHAESEGDILKPQQSCREQRDNRRHEPRHSSRPSHLNEPPRELPSRKLHSSTPAAGATAAAVAVSAREGRSHKAKDTDDTPPQKHSAGLSSVSPSAAKFASFDELSEFSERFRSVLVPRMERFVASPPHYNIEMADEYKILFDDLARESYGVTRLQGALSSELEEKRKGLLEEHDSWQYKLNSVYNEDSNVDLARESLHELRKLDIMLEDQYRPRCQTILIEHSEGGVYGPECKSELQYLARKVERDIVTKLLAYTYWDAFEPSRKRELADRAADFLDHLYRLVDPPADVQTVTTLPPGYHYVLKRTETSSSGSMDPLTCEGKPNPDIERAKADRRKRQYGEYRPTSTKVPYNRINEALTKPANSRPLDSSPKGEDRKGDKRGEFRESRLKFVWRKALEKARRDTPATSTKRNILDGEIYTLNSDSRTEHEWENSGNAVRYV